MRTGTLLLSGLLAGAAFAAGTALSQEGGEGGNPPPKPGEAEEFKGADPREHAPEEMGRRMAESVRANRFHKALERFLGDWDVEMRMWMTPGGPPATSKGTGSWTWLYEGKWLQGDVDVPMMGMRVRQRTVLGYDNFKRKYVSSAVNSMETALRHAEGNFGKEPSVLWMYGAVDEYMTGEHDKTAALVYRFDGPDRITLEIHDLSIGLENAKVLEFVFTRRK
jgi:hypothetical protein